jgi:hypothetical protein
MKKTLFAVIIILCSFTTYAQTDSSIYYITKSDKTIEINSIETNLLLSRNNKSQFIKIDCSDKKYLYFYDVDNYLNRLPIKKINFEKGISFSKINNPSINTALTKFSNAAQTALILPILGGLASIPLGFPNGFYAIGGATALSFIIHLASFRHLKEFARYNSAIDFDEW